MQNNTWNWKTTTTDLGTVVPKNTYEYALKKYEKSLTPEV